MVVGSVRRTVGGARVGPRGAGLPARPRPGCGGARHRWRQDGSVRPHRGMPRVCSGRLVPRCCAGSWVSPVSSPSWSRLRWAPTPMTSTTPKAPRSPSRGPSSTRWCAGTRAAGRDRRRRGPARPGPVRAVRDVWSAHRARPPRGAAKRPDPHRMRLYRSAPAQALTMRALRPGTAPRRLGRDGRTRTPVGGPDRRVRCRQDALVRRRTTYWFRLTCSWAASVASLRWSCSPTRRLNLPE